MRVLILVVALFVLFALVGWVTFSSESGRSSINVETNEIRQDTGEVLHKGSELLEDAEEEVAPGDRHEQSPTSDSTP
jgi:hypothetical protein